MNIIITIDVIINVLAKNAMSFVSSFIFLKEVPYITSSLSTSRSSLSLAMRTSAR
jgi:hypothetical protein